MKKFLFLFLILGLAASPQMAKAFNNETTIQTGVAFYEADDECAVETEFTSFEGGGNIFGTEGLFVNGVKWGDLSELPTSGYEVGDKIAWGTEALGIKWNYNFDVTLKAELCFNLKLGDQIQYIGSGGTPLSTYVVAQEPILMGAYSFNESTSGYDYIDLNTTRLTLTRLDGTTISFGGGEPPSTQDGDTGNGCSLAMASSGAASLGGWLGLAGLLGFMGWRRLRA